MCIYIMCIYIYIHIHTYVYTHTHTHTHLFIWLCWVLVVPCGKTLSCNRWYLAP